MLILAEGKVVADQILRSAGEEGAVEQAEALVSKFVAERDNVYGYLLDADQAFLRVVGVSADDARTPAVEVPVAA